MEVLEEGNLMDRVPILLQRDLEFYQVQYPNTDFVGNYVTHLHITDTSAGTPGTNLLRSCGWKAGFSTLRFLCGH